MTLWAKTRTLKIVSVEDLGHLKKGTPVCSAALQPTRSERLTCQALLRLKPLWWDDQSGCNDENIKCLNYLGSAHQSIS
jgi:hypothetical protein